MVCGGQHVDRHADERQRQDRPPAHGVDVADRVGGGDAAEVERVVDDGHEEVGGGDQRLLVVELVDRGVVGGLDADQQLLRDRHRRRALEDLATARRARSCSRSRRRGRARSGAVRRHSGAFIGGLQRGAGGCNPASLSAFDAGPSRPSPNAQLLARNTPNQRFGSIQPCTPPKPASRSSASKAARSTCRSSRCGCARPRQRRVRRRASAR